MSCGIRGCVLDRRYAGETDARPCVVAGVAGQICRACGDLVVSQKAMQRLERMRRRARRLGARYR
jgi:hypothetical protein